MAIVVLLFFFFLIIEGVECRDWNMVLFGAVPFVLGILGAGLQIYADKQLRDLQKQNPKVREICKEIDRIKRR